jgi:hypothetical protein
MILARTGLQHVRHRHSKLNAEEVRVGESNVRYGH